MTSRFVKEVGRNFNQEAPTAGPGSGTVTSVAMTVPSILSVTGTPITTSGTFVVGLVNQLANTVWAGPVSGSEDVPTFRGLVSDDIPNLDISKITSGTLGVDRGGTGATTLTGVLIGNGTSAFSGIASTTPNQMLRVDALGTGYEWFTPDYMSNPMTSLGDMIYGNAVGLPIRLAGNTTTTKKFLSQTGDGTDSDAPEWLAITAADVNAVPYTGATGNVDLGEYGITAGYYGLDLTPTGTPTTQGTMYWDGNAETVALIMNGTIQKIGEDTFFQVKNQSGSTIAKGTAVRFDGTDGASGKLLIAPFLADGSYPSQYYMGITSEEITNGSNGKVYHFGKMRMVNTSAFTDGDILYCSTTTPGGFQTTIPVAPNNIIIAAAVINAANNGTLMIRSTLGSNIKADEGVKLTSIANNDILVYNSTSTLFENQTKTTFLSGVVPTSRTLTINDVAFDLSANRSWSVGDFGTW